MDGQCTACGQGLYDPRFEHDACGIGAIVSIKGVKTHKTVDDALKIVERLRHRAGCDAAGKTGDGVGILLQIPHAFFSAAASKLGIDIGPEGCCGVGMFFLPRDERARDREKKLFEVVAEKDGLSFLGWREVPTVPSILGETARDCMPCICQCFIAKPEGCPAGLPFDRLLFAARREFEQSAPDTYVVSLSSRTIVYKGMFLVDQLRAFYPDLSDKRFASALALVHSRFSTNTLPSWQRAHPNRLILHNGEINTIRGNIGRMLAREETMRSDALEPFMDKVLPVVDAGGSDSAMLDNALEFLMMSGIELPRAVMMLIPEPWRQSPDMSREKKDMYHYYSTMMEPWDGPAAVLFSDGDVVGAVLDRNGLRPARYYVTSDGYLILSSEVGVLEIPPEKILRKGRLQPGKMLLADTREKRIVSDDELKRRYALRKPYGEWLDQNLIRLSDLPVPNKKVPVNSQETRDRLYKAFGYAYEDVRSVILPMAKTGSEPTASMGADIPLAVLSEKHQPLFSYFKQLFAQVTNPPIDAIREEIVTDTSVYVGTDGNLLEDRAENCRVLEIRSPILSDVDLLKIRGLSRPGFRAETVSILYFKNTPLEKALDRLFLTCDRAFRSGANIIVLSDRGVDENHVAIPSLLAVSALEQYLVRTKKRTAVSVILESGEPRDVHQFAALLGYGARAVNPYLAHECIGELVEKGLLDKDYYAAVSDYDAAVLRGIVKVASKMGISTIQSYQSAQIFEAVGISRDVIDRYFTNTVSRVGGIGLPEIEEGVEWRHDRAFDPMGLGTDTTIDSTGTHKLRSGCDKEDHMWNPLTVLTLQKAVREGDFSLFREYSELAHNDAVPHTLRGLLSFVYPEGGGVPIGEVEPASEIVRRFKTGAMSYGAISQEAHECMAQAMNSIGARSNTGEGGELAERFGTDRNSAVKQVASGRFGVTSQYLMSAGEIQIKMAQGAKPGEGGYLPGKKVYPWVARTRCSTPGVPLISPPPHHDIYSIEDLAQLIYDLKNANRAARISVKLASEAGVGTIAAGVAKAGAQTILISGCDGGTGAAPLTSIYNAGLPWELGVSETHQALVKSGLRRRVAIEADGKLMTGRDVAIACMLGAEEFGFATAPLICMGCVMMRACSLDTCPMGIATQDPELRKNFRGKPEYVVNFMMFVAEELRGIMAKLGVRRVEDLVGRSDLLRMREKQVTKRAASVDMSAVLRSPWSVPQHFEPEQAYDFGLEKTADERILLKELDAGAGKKSALSLNVSNTDRAFGAIFGSEITKHHGNSLPDDTFTVNCRGSGGQSFGAFIPKGLTLDLTGDANDYFGKGLSGGKLVLRPPEGAAFEADRNIIVGNVALYGATGGEAYISGIAGERFAVRNSGAVAVVEGVGDHGCEYMTGGCVAVLGPTGKNFAAGMSGGVAYVWDEHSDLYQRINKSMADMLPLTERGDVETLLRMIGTHARLTGSPRAKRMLENFEECVRLFKKILPRDYDRVLRTVAECEKRGVPHAEAMNEAFYVIAKGGAR